MSGNSVDSGTLAHRLVGHCMSRQIASASPYDTLAQAYSTMCLRGIRRLPVVEHGKLVGIITRSDILEAKPTELGHGADFGSVMRDLDRITVGVAMHRAPVAIYEADTLGHAAELMLEHKVGGLPVLDARDALVGVITESDLFRLVAAQWRADNARR
ncbi:MAG: CBS domain-containing protein [Gammaproteobacteria bacterium]